MKEEKMIIAVFIGSIQIVLNILSFCVSFNRKDILAIIISVGIFIICVIHNIYSEIEPNKNIFFSAKLYNINPICLFIALLIMGGLPIVFQFILGHIYRFHHIFNNIVTIPLTLTALIQYMHNLNKKFRIIEKVNMNKSKLVFKLSPLIVQGSMFYVTTFLLSQDRNPARIYFWGLNISSDGFNMLYLMINLSLFLICFLYILLYCMLDEQNDKNKNYTYKNLFPKWPLTGVVLFFIIWGCMAFYETDNRIEIAYYVSAFFVVCAIIVLTILLWLKLNTKNGLGTLLYNFAIAITLGIYSTIIAYLESNKYSKVKVEGNTSYSAISVMILMLIAIIVVAALFIDKIAQKYSIDSKE